MEELDIIRLDLPATYKYLNVLGASIGEVMKRAEEVPGLDALSYNIQLAVHEACTNIVGHAYEGVDNGRIKIALSLVAKPGQFIVELEDTGRSFDPSLVHEPDLENGQIHGYGLFLMRSLMDEVSYLPLPNCNRWRLVKNL